MARITADPTVKVHSVLRRHMDLAKLLDLLHSKTMYLRRADGFSDRLEAALFPLLRKSMDEAYAAGAGDGADAFYRRARMGNFVSCWSIGARDNMALWQLYGGTKTSVALTTTVERLLSCAARWERDVHLSRVLYLDHRHVHTYAIGPYADVLRYKNDAFKFEREIRLIIPQQVDDLSLNPMGIRVEVPDLNRLVRSVVVAPEADDDFVAAVRDLCEKYQLTAPVRRSTLAQMPV